jgi:ABC-type lipopolysaccharide export system ATPase subunit
MLNLMLFSVFVIDERLKYFCTNFFISMKVTDHLKQAKKSLVSFEILPPLKGKTINSIYDHLDPLMDFNPAFINVTYHRSEQEAKLEILLDELRLGHVRLSNGDVLSGGERRRTEIARALAVDPKFILLDEPFAGIDPIAVEDIQSIITRLKEKNIGILITDHNVNETLSICDRAYLLIEGKIFKHGTSEELAQDEQVRNLYLGRNFELKRKDFLHTEL